MAAEKLTPAQQELFDAIKSGVQVLRSWDYPRYWMRRDTCKKVTQAAIGLLHKGACQVSNPSPAVRFYDKELRIAERAAQEGSERSALPQTTEQGEK